MYSNVCGYVHMYAWVCSVRVADPYEYVCLKVFLFVLGFCSYFIPTLLPQTDDYGVF